MLTAVAPGVQPPQATAAEQSITGLPQTLTGTAGIPLGMHAGVGYGEIIAAIRQDISAGLKTFTAAIDWGDGTATKGNAYLDLSLAADTQHRTYSVFDVHTYAQAGTYPITVVFSEDGVPEATVTSTATIGGTTSTATIGGTTSTATIGGTANQRFVDQVYRDLLGRPPEADGLAAWLAQLDRGTSRGQIVAHIEQSAEYRRDEVTAIYQHYLHRPADPAALEMGAELLSQEGTDEQLSASVAGSPEYFALLGGTNEGFLAALFQDALNRPIDAEAKAAFGQVLAAGASRTQIAAIVFASHEYHADVVDAADLELLHRDADAAGLSFWTGQLDAGLTTEQLIASLAASDEYFGRSA